MIARYTHSEMSQVWKDERKYYYWLKVEKEAALATVGDVLTSAEGKKLRVLLEKVERSGRPKVSKILKIEEKTKHDVIAFVTALADELGDYSRFIHFGLTSSDVVDTAFSMQIQEAGKILIAELDAVLGTLKKMAIQYERLPCMGRSHGMFAEPTTFGLKLLGFYSEWWRVRERFLNALEECRFGKISGAVGTHSHFGPKFEEKVMSKLGLKPEPMSTQVIPRDRHANLFSIFALVAGALERLAIELRHLQRTEVGEVREGFSKGQKGSSAMPHKRNPISSENLTGCARVLRSYTVAIYENVALWHERDISHSSVERIIFPDAFVLAAYSVRRLNGVLSGLHVNRTQMESNLKLAGSTYFSGHILLALVRKGVLRDQAYVWVQEASHRAIDANTDFITEVMSHVSISKYLNKRELEKIASIEHGLRNVSAVFKRAFAEMKL